jgi:hypothetical protein
MTVPLGVPAPPAVALTVPVNVTDWPDTEGFTDEVTVVAVCDWFTVCVKTGDVLVVKLVFPP